MAKAPKSSKKTTEPDRVEDAEIVEESAPEPEAEPSEPEAKAASDQEPEPVVQPEPDAELAPEPEPEAEAAPEPDTAPEAPAPAPAQARGGVGVALGLVGGGVLAAVIGFTAARTVVPEGWPFPGVTPKVDPLVARVDDQAKTLATLQSQVSDLDSRLAAREADKSAAIADDELTRQINALKQELDGATARMDDLAKRLAAVEKMAPEGSAAAQAAADAYARELANLREMFQGELDKVKAAEAGAAQLQASAAEAQKAAAGRAALARVMAALDTGGPFDGPLSDLEAATGITPPAPLADLAAKGVPTLAALQQDFPPAARAALDAALRADVAAGKINRFSAFLRTQLGTRSLEPKPGDDPDAVLSRAEGALRKGNIADALSELDALPEAAKAPLSDWRAEAQTRLDALSAGARLADQLK